jgi:AcrR family transcriptional regulator
MARLLATELTAGRGTVGPVPKRVDHEERRRQITDALLRTAAARGLHATGMREVAAEAGVSLRLIQYYFGTKEELLLAAMQRLAAQFGERVQERIKRLKESGSPVNPAMSSPPSLPRDCPPMTSGAPSPSSTRPTSRSR